MNRYKKGDYGYLNAYKKSKLIWTLIFAIMIAIVVVGTLIMFGDTSRVIIVIAILLALPFAKFLIAYIMCAPFKQMSKEEYKKICDGAGDTNGVCLGVYFDVVLSHYEGMHFYPSVCVKNGRIYALVQDKQFSAKKKEYEKWITRCITDSKYNYTVTLYDNIDAYIKKIGSISTPNDKTLLIDRHIAEKIFNYCV